MHLSDLPAVLLSVASTRLGVHACACLLVVTYFLEFFLPCFPSSILFLSRLLQEETLSALPYLPSYLAAAAGSLFFLETWPSAELRRKIREIKVTKCVGEGEGAAN